MALPFMIEFFALAAFVLVALVGFLLDPAESSDSMIFSSSLRIGSRSAAVRPTPRSANLPKYDFPSGDSSQLFPALIKSDS